MPGRARTCAVYTPIGYDQYDTASQKLEGDSMETGRESCKFYARGRVGVGATRTRCVQGVCHRVYTLVVHRVCRSVMARCGHGTCDGYGGSSSNSRSSGRSSAPCGMQCVCHVTVRGATAHGLRGAEVGRTPFLFPNTFSSFYIYNIEG